jgi:hypothetical protein
MSSETTGCCLAWSVELFGVERGTAGGTSEFRSVHASSYVDVSRERESAQIAPLLESSSGDRQTFSLLLTLSLALFA